MEDFVYFTLEDILLYYRETINQSGGGFSGIKEQGGIEKVLDFVQNNLYYPTLEDKLTYLVYAFCTGHYFEDGNKRISLVIGAHFLIRNKKYWAGLHFLPYMEAYIWHVAAGNITKNLLRKIIHAVINRQELEETTKLELIQSLEKNPIHNEYKDDKFV